MDDITRYLQEADPLQRKQLFTVQNLVHSFFPDAKASIRHRMPTYEIGNGLSVSLARQKQGLAFYCSKGGLVEKQREALPHCEVGNGCIRFKETDHALMESLKAILTELAEQRA